MTNWYIKDRAEDISDDDSFKGDYDWKVPYLFHTGSKWKEDDAYLTQEEFERLEPAGTKFGNDVCRLREEESQPHIKSERELSLMYFG